jgi:hypothetical protein
MIQNLRLGTVMPDKLPYPCKLIEASYCTAANTAGRGKIRRVSRHQGKTNVAMS